MRVFPVIKKGNNYNNRIFRNGGGGGGGTGQESGFNGTQPVHRTMMNHSPLLPIVVMCYIQLFNCFCLSLSLASSMKCPFASVFNLNFI